MKRTIQVFLGQTPRHVGTLRYDVDGARESASFEYSSAWLAAGDRFAIDPNLALVPGPQFHKKARGGSVFSAAIADTEPDGWGRRVILRDRAKRRSKGGPPNALELLLAVDDASRLGALRFQDEDAVFQRAPTPGGRAIPPLVELTQLLHATRAVEAHTETAQDLAYLLGRGTSLGGLRPKCVVVDEKGRLSIGKFPSAADERSVTKSEVLALRLAKKAGINAAEARLLDCDGVAVALIRRFDRAPRGGRIPYISAATMLGAETGAPAEHAYTELVDALRQHGAEVDADVEELWRRIAFSILITNVDDHLQNHGFLHASSGLWRLAPAFDVNPFPDRVRELKTWISEDSGPAASVDVLRSVAPYFRLSAARAKEILREVERAVASWRKEGKKLGMTEAELEPFEEAFEHQERRAARSA